MVDRIKNDRRLNNMKYCRKCGTKMNDDAVFCSKCGCREVDPDQSTIDNKITNDVSGSDARIVHDSAATSINTGNNQFIAPSNTPPLIEELSLMYKKISDSAKAIAVVDALGAIDWLLLGFAFMGQPQRLAIPGILFIIYSIGMAVAAVRNFKVYKTDCDLSNRLLKNPAQTLTEVINLFRNVEENNRLSKSISGLDSFNIFFRFYKVGKYVEKYDCINNYLAENSEPLEYIMRSYGGNVTGEKISDDELLKQQAAFSVQPVNNYQKNLKFKLRAIVVGVILVILIPILISLNSTMRNSENKDKPGKNPAESSVTQQNSSASVTEGISSNESTPKQYTAEEFIDKYNELAMDTDDKVDTINLSDAKKEKDDDGTLYYMINVNLQKSIFLTLDGNDYSGKISSVCLISVIPDGDDSVYPYEVANTISVFVNNISFSDACSVCEKAMKNQEYTDSSITGIVLRNRIGTGETNNYDNWIVELTDSDSTAVQSDSNADESSQASETSPENEISDNDYSSELEQLEQERINTLNELKTSADKMLHESYNKNDYEAVQQKEIESIINKYMEQINNATVANDVNKLYAAAINEINNVKTKKQLAGESSQAAPVKLYADKLFDYNGVTYYTPSFSGKGDTGNLDFSALGNKYKALTLPDMYDSYGRQVNIDSFIIVGDVVYFTDQEAGSVSPLPAKLYMMNLDGSACTLIAEDVDVRFYCEGNIIYFASCYSSDDSYTYSISSGEKKYIGKRISLDNSDMIFYSNDRVEYNGGIYYKENLVYYREDKATGSVQVVGHSVGGGQQ